MPIWSNQSNHSPPIRRNPSSTATSSVPNRPHSASPSRKPSASRKPTTTRSAPSPPLLYAAYSSQNDEDGELHISALSFANGGSGKKLLNDVAQLIAALKPASLSGALDGTAPALDAKSLRWNPREFRAAAFRGHDPGKGIKGDDSLDHPAFNILAFFGLTFLPCAPTTRSGLTPAIHSVDRESAFVWPVWNHPLSPDSVTALLHQPPASVGRAHGIARRWKARRFTVDKSLYFSPATVATL
jgi:hypothetical protein